MRRTTRAGLTALVAASALATAAAGAHAEELAATTTENGMQVVITFDDRDPRDVKRLQISGLTPGDRVTGLDVRPATDTLYGLGTSAASSQNYIVQLNYDDRPADYDGRALFTPVGARFGTAGATFGYDFNPTVDRIRVISDTNQNLRVNPDTGAAIVDGPIAYAAGDRNAGRDPNAVGAGYLPAPFGGMTTLYDVDSSQDVLAIQNPANAGTLMTVGSLGPRVTDVLGFDIGERNHAFAALQREGRAESRLYRVELRRGRARAAGRIGADGPVEGLAIVDDGDRRHDGDGRGGDDSDSDSDD
jgi:Domain of unknown function (DUF4394)